MFQRKTSYHTSLFVAVSQPDEHATSREHRGRLRRRVLTLSLSFLSFITFIAPLQAEDQTPNPNTRHWVIPILGTTLNDDWEQVGIVAEVNLDFLKREDHNGLKVRFHTTPGRFSLLAQRSVTDAIVRVAESADLNTDSWTIWFTLPYAGVTLYGESLSAMAALSVMALAKNDPLHEDIVMTGTVTPEGDIGVVGGVPLKIVAAYESHFKRVLIPEEHDVADGDWRTPFLMHVSPVRSLDRAYLALTDKPLFSTTETTRLSASLVP